MLYHFGHGTVLGECVLLFAKSHVCDVVFEFLGTVILLESGVRGAIKPG